MISYNLYKAVDDMGYCNDMFVKPLYQLPRSLSAYGYDYDILNVQVNRLTHEELLTFIDGEDSEVKELTEKYKIQELNNFMNDVFDGKLTHLFMIQ